MTAKGPTQLAIRRAIQAARKEGLHVLAIRPDGSVVVGPDPIAKSDVIEPPAPQQHDEHAAWKDVEV